MFPGVPALTLLRWTQLRTFRKADGLIFLTQYAREGVTKVVRCLAGRTVTIPHGVDARFFCPPRDQKGLGSYSEEKPYRILYVSIVISTNISGTWWRPYTQLREEGTSLVA